jgi:hypothetical protein
LSHHLYVWDFARANFVRFGLVILIWREFSRARATSGRAVVDAFAVGSLVVSAGGIALSSLDFDPDLVTSLLRFYWFRVADFAIPLAATVALVHAATETSEPVRAVSPWVRRWVAGGLLAIGLAWFVIHAWQQLSSRVSGSDRQSLPAYPDSSQRTEQTRKNWRRVCEWIRDHTPRDALFLTPRFQQTFKWHAQRAEYVNWKDIPQDARRVVEWSRRMSQAYGPNGQEPTALWLDEDSFRELVRAHRIRYVVAEQWHYHARLSEAWVGRLTRVYPEDPRRQTTYVVLSTESLIAP